MAAKPTPRRLYLARVSAATRQIVEARQRWMAELERADAGIGTAPEGRVLEQLGRIGARYATEFEDLSKVVAGIETARGMIDVQRALFGWVDTLHRACSTLVDARMRRDRTLLRRFREQLGLARVQAASLQIALARHGVVTRPRAGREAAAQAA